jgi:hypothetical protein
MTAKSSNTSMIIAVTGKKIIRTKIKLLKILTSSMILGVKQMILRE